MPELERTPTMPAVLSHAATAYASRPFVVTESSSVTFAELDQRSAALAKALLTAGVGKGSRVGFHHPNGVDWVVTWAAIGRVGAIAVPMSTLATPAELGRGVRHTDVGTLLVPRTLFGRDHQEFLERAVPGLAATGDARLRLEAAPHLRSIWISGPPNGASPWAIASDDAIARGERRVSDALLAAVEHEVVAGDDLMIVSTSGSTNAPKAVVHTHGAVFRKSAMPTPIVAPPGGTVFLGHAFFWIGGILNLGAALHGGATLLCQERPDTEAALRLMARHGATAVMAWPTTQKRLREHPLRRSLPLDGVPALEEPAFAPSAFHSSLGMTETLGPHTEGARAGAPDRERIPPLPPHLHGSFGAPVPFVEHRIADPVSGATLPPGVEGEVCVRGYSLLRGLYKRERHEVFDDDGWYHTGDRGCFRHGYLFFTGRADAMIKTHGANVSPREVEVALESCDGVRQAFVLGVPDVERGQRVVAGLVVAENAEPDLTGLRTALTDLVANYKIPRQFVVLHDDDVPWLASGKPDRIAIDLLVADRCTSPSDDDRREAVGSSRA